MGPAILDTDILSEVLKQKNAQVLLHAGQYLATHRRLAFSTMTIYEIVRGLNANQSNRQLADFLALANTSETFPIDLPVLMRAADLWVEGKRGGHPSDDADLIIAATALEAGRVLVTGNTPHFAWISGLILEDWRLP